MHAAALRGFTRNLEAIALQLRQMHDGRYLRVLDMGGQDVNGTVHSQLRDRGFGGALDVLDIEQGVGVTIVGDARNTDWWDGQSYDLVISTEMLEHLDDWWDSLDVAAQVLRPGGWFVGTCASLGRAPHGATGAPSPAPGEYYDNIRPTELAAGLGLRGFDPVEVQYSYDTSEPHGAGDLYWRARKAS